MLLHFWLEARHFPRCGQSYQARIISAVNRHGFNINENFHLFNPMLFVALLMRLYIMNF